MNSSSLHLAGKNYAVAEASLDYQTRRANLLAEMIRLFSSNLPINETLEKIVEKSTGALGDAAFIVLVSEGRLRLEAAYCAERERLVRMLIGAWNAEPGSSAGKALQRLLDDGEPLFIENLHRHAIAAEVHSVIEQCRLTSLIAAPIRTEDRRSGVFISLSSGSHVLTSDDFELGIVLSGFIGSVLEYSRALDQVRSGHKDFLTGLYNTNFFQDALARETARAQRHGTGLSLLMVDIDGVESVSNAEGPAASDKLLSHVAGVIRQSVRNTDFVCRCGGDEFGILLPGTELQGAERVAEKIVEKVQANQVLVSLGIRGHITLRVGAAEYQKGSDLESLVNDSRLKVVAQSAQDVGPTF